MLFCVFYELGWVLGEYGEWVKYSNFDVIIRVFLMFYVSGRTVSFLDVGEKFFFYIDFFDFFSEVMELGIYMSKCYSLIVIVFLVYINYFIEL